MTRAAIIQFGRYFSVAAAGVLMDWAIFALLAAGGCPPAAAQSISRASAAILAFYGFRRMVFAIGGEDAEIQGQTVRFLVAVIVVWVVSIGSVWCLSQVMPLWLAKGITDGSTFLANWFVMKFFVFRGLPRVEARG